MTVTSVFTIAVAGLFVGMLLVLGVGRRIGARRKEDDAEVPAGVSLLDGSLFALLGFLVALTYSGADSRFQARRQQIVEEANSISSAYQLVDLVPADAQPKLRQTFRLYIDSRIAAFQKLPDIEAMQRELDRSGILQKEIWKQTIVAVRNSPPQTAALVLPAMNHMSDVATTRTWIAQTHAMVLTYGLLFLVALTSCLLAGVTIGKKKTSWLHLIAFAAVISATIYVIIDLEYPRMGVINIYDFDQALIDVRNGM